MKTYFRAFIDKAIYYWTLLRLWTNPNMPRWALALLLAAGLAGCEAEPNQPRVVAGPNREWRVENSDVRIVALVVGSDDAEIARLMDAGWLVAAYTSRDARNPSVILRKPTPVIDPKKAGAKK